MQYEELINQILDYPADSRLYPMDSHRWVHIPTHLMDNNKPLVDYFPNDFNFNLSVSMGLLDYCNSVYTPLDTDIPNVIEHLNIGILNGYTQEYIIFGSVITVLVDGNIYQFSRG